MSNPTITDHALWRAAERLGRSVDGEELERDCASAVRSSDRKDGSIERDGELACYVVRGDAIITVLPRK